MGLSELRKSLLYGNALDVWIALSEERGWEWRSVEAYRAFLEFLRKQGVRLSELAVCVEEQGEKAGFVKRYSRETGEVFKVYTLRMDDAALARVRSFRKNE